MIINLFDNVIHFKLGRESDAWTGIVPKNIYLSHEIQRLGEKVERRPKEGRYSLTCFDQSKLGIIHLREIESQKAIPPLMAERTRLNIGAISFLS